ncbi:hypothetical protein [Granulicella sp. S190]|uniref:hypothetical protein n=1 Tax=Granulicella sp. S190 TaxID=1747226 RepID=UPI00131C6685|nr:hypothetical protein [Granulicella sp. S190]
MSVFKRGLNDNFIAALAELAQKPGWWRDVLADASLIIGIRDEKFDVYWNGQSLFNADFQGGRVNVNTHVKYLLDPDRSDRVAFDENGNFHEVTTPMLTRYTSGTLSKLKRAADLFSGMEKQGVHAIVRANENIIDVEIRLDARDLDSDRDQPRIDIAAFEQRPDGVELVFWEAKLFANKELRAAGPAPVVKQIKEYQQVLQARQLDVLSSYRRVAKNLVAIAQMSGVRVVGSAIQAVSDGEELRMSSTANVGLVIFGFDADQKAVGGIGHKHFEKLKAELGEKMLRASGVADGLKLCLLG